MFTSPEHSPSAMASFRTTPRLDIMATPVSSLSVRFSNLPAFTAFTQYFTFICVRLISTLRRMAYNIRPHYDEAYGLPL
jgi:hypothetical protein